MNGFYTTMAEASPFWMFLLVAYIVLAGAACIIMIRSVKTRRIARRNDARITDLEDLTRPLARLKQLRALNEERNGHHKDEKAA